MKTTIDMAREAGAMFDHMMWIERDLLPVFQRFEALVRADEREETNCRANASWTLMCEKMVAAEREACAKVCDEAHELMNSSFQGAAAAIRNRGNT